MQPEPGIFDLSKAFVRGRVEKATGENFMSAEIDHLRESLADLWAASPLHVRRALFVVERAGSFGDFSPRASSRVKPGEKLVVYVEPVGYVWRAEGDFFHFGVATDFLVKSSTGQILGGQDNFSSIVLRSRARVTEFMLNLTLTPDGAPAADYVLQFTLRDLHSDKSAKFELPFSIAR
jgi:hypothetical protein